jgi:hypothetical protein
VAAADSEPNIVTDRQAVKLRSAQRQIRTLASGGVALEELGHSLDELDQALRPVSGSGTAAPDVLPLARRMACADADSPRRENVKGGGLCRHMHGLADAPPAPRKSPASTTQ